MALSDHLDSTLQQIMDINDYGSYYTDLELAAAIGKNLLERNKELEHLLHSTQEYAEEQVKKSEFLTRQLDEAHKMNESRVKLMEQIESNSEELSRNHNKLKRETKSIQEHNQLLAESLQSLVEKCDNYKAEMEDLKLVNARLQRQLSQNSPGNTNQKPHDVEKEIVKKEVKKLSSAIKKLQVEQELEKTTRHELENDLSQLISQNEELELKLREFAKKGRDSYIEVNEEDGDNCVNLGEEIVDEKGDMGEAFVLVGSHDINETERNLSPKCQISFLDELDQQYHDLVQKYNVLLEKCKSEGIPYESRQLCMVQRGVQTSGMEPAVLEAKEEVPEYKKMFAKIYEKLQDC